MYLLIRAFFLLLCSNTLFAGIGFFPAETELLTYERRQLQKADPAADPYLKGMSLEDAEQRWQELAERVEQDGRLDAKNWHLLSRLWALFQDGLISVQSPTKYAADFPHGYQAPPIGETQTVSERMQIAWEALGNLDPRNRTKRVFETVFAQEFPEFPSRFLDNTYLNALALTGAYLDQFPTSTEPRITLFKACLVISADILDDELPTEGASRQLLNEVFGHVGNIVAVPTSSSWRTPPRVIGPYVGTLATQKLLGEGTSAGVSSTNIEGIALKVFNDWTTALLELSAWNIIQAHRSPFVGRIWATSIQDGSPGIVMERYPRTLRQLIRTKELELWRIQVYMRQILMALKAIHEAGVYHSDLNPRNILLASDGTIRVMDFSSARFRQGQRSSQAQMTTLWYRSPEHINEGVLDFPVGPFVDLWSAGCVLAEMVRRAPLFPARTDTELRQFQASLFRPNGGRFRELQAGLGQMGMEFLRQLLNPNFRTRISAAQALQHPFLNQ